MGDKVQCIPQRMTLTHNGSYGDGCRGTSFLFLVGVCITATVAVVDTALLACFVQL